MSKTCFCIIPFQSNFDDVSEIIRLASETTPLQLTYVRGDMRKNPGIVLSHIERDIRQAAVVVADISDHNARPC